MTFAPDILLDGRVQLFSGDCLAVLDTLPENSLDSAVCDPPYHLTSIVKRFGGKNAAPAKDYSLDSDGANGASAARTGAYARASKGFMGKEWDGGDIAFRAETWAKVYRVLKPGACLLAFSASRTFGRMQVAIEDAGFEMRDGIFDLVFSDAAVVRFLESLSPDQREAFGRCVNESGFGGLLAWIYGSGFPKSHDVSKAIDKALGAERKIIGTKTYGKEGAERSPMVRQAPRGTINVTAAESDMAKQWEGWGTALKPAIEPVVFARKPLDGTVAANVLKHGVGALNIDGCRVASENLPSAGRGSGFASQDKKNAEQGFRPREYYSAQQGVDYKPSDLGRWPANVLHDGSPEVLAAFPNADGQQGYVGPEHGDRKSQGIYGDFGARSATPPRDDSGSASRFFYTAKADAHDRVGSKHPTVKPIELMRYLVRLVTPKGGTVLDMFAGSGTTGEAAFYEGCNAVLIEREPEYQNDIRRRMKLAIAGPEERSRESIKAKQADKPLDAGPLFGGMEST
ncbi:MAG TPA: DNA methyltransferase [Xanthobacteraceae bacterium]|nr:DNA methyltransferase [Xanthobacteraceae bacterium]